MKHAIKSHKRIFKTACLPLQSFISIIAIFNNLQQNRRCCFYCQDVVEDEKHALFQCPLYVEVRADLVSALNNISDIMYDDMSDNVELNLTLGNDKLMHVATRTCNNILNDRKKILYSRSWSS